MQTTTGWSRHCLRYCAINCSALAPEVFLGSCVLGGSQEVCSATSMVTRNIAEQIPQPHPRPCNSRPLAVRGRLRAEAPVVSCVRRFPCIEDSHQFAVGLRAN